MTGTNSGFVLAGRSLRLVEQREQNLAQITLAGWIAALVLSLVSVILVDVIVSHIATSSTALDPASNNRTRAKATNPIDAD